MNNIEGQIFIDIDLHNNRVSGVNISSTRPLQLQNILVGKTPEQAMSIIPLMYNICGSAQSQAALLSIQQAQQLDPDPKLQIARNMLLLVEIAREHLLRIFLDWPKLFALDTGKYKLTAISQLGTKFQSALFNDGKAFSLHSSLDVNYSNLEKLINELQQYLQKYVFSIQPLDWLEQKDLAATIHWSEHSNTIASQAVSHIYNNGWSAQGKCNCRHLPDLNGRQLLEQFDKDNSDHFIARPQWQQHCFETTVLSRQASQTLIQSLFQNFQNSLLTRWLARLVDLAKIPQQLGILMKNLEMQSMHMSSSQHQNLGLAQVETARGRLIHRVEIKHGLISKYQILAPTEWNFHPQGVVAQSLAGLKTNNRKELEQLARLIINAIDPCVGYKLRIH